MIEYQVEQRMEENMRKTWVLMVILFLMAFTYGCIKKSVAEDTKSEKALLEDLAPAMTEGSNLTPTTQSVVEEAPVTKEAEMGATESVAEDPVTEELTAKTKMIDEKTVNSAPAVTDLKDDAKIEKIDGKIEKKLDTTSDLKEESATDQDTPVTVEEPMGEVGGSVLKMPLEGTDKVLVMLKITANVSPKQQDGHFVLKCPTQRLRSDRDYSVDRDRNEGNIDA